MTQKEVLKKLRKITGKSQTEFAEKVGVFQHRISRYENEVDKISLQMFLDWCATLDIDPEAVFVKKNAD